MKPALVGAYLLACSCTKQNRDSFPSILICKIQYTIVSHQYKNILNKHLKWKGDKPKAYKSLHVRRYHYNLDSSHIIWVGGWEYITYVHLYIRTV